MHGLAMDSSAYRLTVFPSIGRGVELVVDTAMAGVLAVTRDGDATLDSWLGVARVGGRREIVTVGVPGQKPRVSLTGLDVVM